MFCPKCGAEQSSDQVVVCFKCGHKFRIGPDGQLAPEQVGTELKCSSCGAPIRPELGDAVVTCEYCGTSLYLGVNGWNDIPTHTMLPLKLPLQNDVIHSLRDTMDKGIFHRRLQESSNLEEISLAMVPYWLVRGMATSSIRAVSLGAEAMKLAAAPKGIDVDTERDYQLENAYQIPILALKSAPQYQPADYGFFKLGEKVPLDASQVKNVKVLRGDLSQDAARTVAKDAVEKIQSEVAHSEYSMIQDMTTEVNISGWEPELLHVPVWYVRYDHDGKKMVFVVDGHSGGIISTSGP